MIDLIGNLQIGLATAATPYNILFCFIGVLVGTLVGVLPGLGTAATIAMLLPVTFGLPPETSLIMLAGIYYGAQYGGSTTSILLRVPGESSAAMTAIDGYEMAKQGRAGPALSMAAISSFIAGCVATVLVAVIAIPMTMAALQFGSVEYFSVMILGLVLAVSIASGSILKAMTMVAFGFLLSLIGADIETAQPRMTMGMRELYDGIDVVVVAMGIFGFAEIIRNIETLSSAKNVFISKITGLMPTLADFRICKWAIARGTAIGSMFGVLPGTGAILSSFAAYALEKKVSRHPERFGKGAIEGVAAPESANNAAAQTGFVTLLTLGIPGNVIMALMMGAMMIQGIQPGPQVMVRQPELFWGIIVSMWIGNLMLIVLNLPLVGVWVKLLRIPYRIMFPAIVVFAAVGVYSLNSLPFDLYVVAIFAFVGYVLAKFEFEPAPLLLGFVLGPLIEDNLRRSMMISRGDPTIFLTQPLSAAMLAIAAAVLIVSVAPTIRKKREVLAEED